MNLNSIILKILDDKASKEELEMLEQWKDQAELNISHMEEHSKIWKNANQLNEYKDYNPDRAWDNINQKMNSEGKWIKYSIAACLFILAGFFIGKFVNDTPEELIIPEYKALDNSVHYVLSDDSEIWLNQFSEVLLDNQFNAKERVVTLKGEAYFDIERNIDKKFKVLLGDRGMVEVLGTEFNIINHENKFEIYVTEGLVAYNDGHKKLELKAGDAVKLMSDGSLVKYRMNDANYLSWKTKNLIFEGSSMKEVFSELSDKFNTPINLSDEVLDSNCKLRSRFIDQDLNSILAELKKILKLDYTIISNEYHINSVQC